MIEARNLGYRLPGGEWLWRDIEVCVRPGTVAGLIGRNGSGKTTLLRALLGLIDPTEGRVAPGTRAGYVPQQTEITFPFSVSDVVSMGRARHVGVFRSLNDADRRAIDRSLALTGLAQFRDRQFQTLSGGERQLVLIARAIATDCDALILDEPFTGLDLDNQGRTLALIRALADEEDMAVLFSAHQPDHLYAVADQALALNRGARAISGETGSVLTGEMLSCLYGVDVRVINLDSPGGRSRHAVTRLYDCRRQNAGK